MTEKKPKKQNLIITVDDKFYIEVDERNYTLCERKGKYDVRHGYYRNIDNCLYRVAKLRVLSSSQQMTVNEYLIQLRNELLRLREAVGSDVKHE